MDEVDEVLAAWERELPEVTTSPLGIWSRITRLAGLLDVERKRCFAEHDLEIWEFDVLSALRRAGQPYRLSPGQLLQLTHVTSGTMTNRVDRLRARGLVLRESDPNDGRGVVVELTPQGRRTVDRALQALVVMEERLLADWEPEDRETLTGMLRRLLADSTG